MLSAPLNKTFTTLLKPFIKRAMSLYNRNFSAIHDSPATDSGRTARTPLYPTVQAVPPFFALNVHVKH